MRTVYGELLSALGVASREVVTRDDDGKLRTRTAAWASPSGDAATEQNEEILIDRDHDHRPVGRCLYLERNRGGLLAVCELEDHVEPCVRVRLDANTVKKVPAPLYFSASSIITPNGELMFDWISLTATPARVAAQPVQWCEGSAYLASRSTSDRYERELLSRAYNDDLRRRHREPLRVRDPQRDRILGRLDYNDAAAWRMQHDQRGALRYSVPIRGSILSVR